MNILCCLSFVRLLSFYVGLLFTFAWVTFVAFDRIRLKVPCQLRMAWRLSGKWGFSRIFMHVPFFFSQYIQSEITSIFLKEFGNMIRHKSIKSVFNLIENFHENDFCWLYFSFATLSFTHTPVQFCCRLSRWIDGQITISLDSKRDFPNYVCTQRI